MTRPHPTAHSRVITNLPGGNSTTTRATPSPTRCTVLQSGSGGAHGTVAATLGGSMIPGPGTEGFIPTGTGEPVTTGDAILRGEGTITAEGMQRVDLGWSDPVADPAV